MRSKYIFICCFCLLSSWLYGQGISVRGTVVNSENEGVIGADIFIVETQRLYETDVNGTFELTDLETASYTLNIFSTSYASQTILLEVQEQNDDLRIQLEAVNVELGTVEVREGREDDLRVKRLKDVDGFGIYASKKTEEIDLTDLIANLATNNPRQVFASVPGLNIWENDGAGLQLGIGARGLDPNRTSNFNTRQNGYDISADALGYPESYYTPPTEALKTIEVVRGAASLQFGPQFGGLLNFQFKDGDIDAPFKLTLSNTVGSFQFLNSFTSIEGHSKKWSYYAFYQRKQGDGWRENAQFDQNTAYASVRYAFSERFSAKFDFTYMNYLAQQPGGLVDFEFEQDPRQSKRERNWFKVNWQLAALHLDYKVSETLKWNTRIFQLNASREALGDLGAINRPDPLRERDLIKGNYQNWGAETRLLKRYQFKNSENIHNFLIGARYYNGFAESRQGDADDTADPNFRFLNPTDLEESDYDFPSQNVSLFAENLFNLTSKWSVTPGIRWEYIDTNADGYFKERFELGGMTIAEERIVVNRSNTRSFALLGLGTSYRFNENLEVYANISQNYRSINFTDLAIANVNLIVDSLLQDESGFNADLGSRGSLLDGHLVYDASLFLIRYNDRIGIGSIIVEDAGGLQRATAYRTNIGNARIYGLESYIEGRQQFFTSKEHALDARLFVNMAFINGKYTSGTSDVLNKNVELIPPFNIKSGLKLRYQNFGFSYQYSYTQEHFTDATNARFFPDATRGIIPSYQVHDVSLSYEFKRWTINANINNLLDSAYFTRRANAYPGPGIISADGRAFYVNLVYQWAKQP